MRFTIRECQPEDILALCELNRIEMGYDYSVTDSQDNLACILSDDSQRIFVAETDGMVVGYVHACNYVVLYAPPMKNIMGIAVRSDCKRNGIGSALLRQVEQWALSSGAKGVRLVSGAARTSAHEFYRSQGYGGGRSQLNFKKWLI